MRIWTEQQRKPEETKAFRDDCRAEINELIDVCECEFMLSFSSFSPSSTRLCGAKIMVINTAKAEKCRMKYLPDVTCKKSRFSWELTSKRDNLTYKRNFSIYNESSFGFCVCLWKWFSLLPSAHTQTHFSSYFSALLRQTNLCLASRCILKCLIQPKRNM